MNIQKFLSQESPPYDSSSNYTVTFTINNPKLLDFSKSYINIPRVCSVKPIFLSNSHIKRLLSF